MSDTSQGPGWWQASDGKWYPPEQAPGAAPTAPPAGPPAGYGAPPAYGAPMGGPAMGAPGTSPYGPLASWAQRVVAYLIDAAVIFVAYIVIAILVAIFGAIADALGVLVGLVGYVAVIGYSFYIFWLQGEVGGTPGKRLTGLKVVSEADGQVIGGGMGIVRQLAHFLDSLACGIGYLFPLWDAKRQTFADKIMKTYVLAEQPKMELGPDLLKK